ncbi:hypothetical protein JCM10212_004840, partial [Sporobolomyces blumeae]
MSSPLYKPYTPKRHSTQASISSLSQVDPWASSSSSPSSTSALAHRPASLVQDAHSRTQSYSNGSTHGKATNRTSVTEGPPWIHRPRIVNADSTDSTSTSASTAESMTSFNHAGGGPVDRSTTSSPHPRPFDRRTGALSGPAPLAGIPPPAPPPAAVRTASQPVTTSTWSPSRPSSSASNASVPNKPRYLARGESSPAAPSSSSASAAFGPGDRRPSSLSGTSSPLPPSSANGLASHERPSSTASPTAPMPYAATFQPAGVRHDRTDEFFESRKKGRGERKARDDRLERRLDK